MSNQITDRFVGAFSAASLVCVGYAALQDDPVSSVAKGALIGVVIGVLYLNKRMGHVQYAERPIEMLLSVAIPGALGALGATLLYALSPIRASSSS